eukprot:TRINITY_DN1923_c0_g2_i1.p1 TRINITY_DN1923_c0_g2~~TRINITY_DN1923_c0_g2_i1.p1  ORF type:complete len:1026 (-),score=277.38 TRINITY_DN1923_c0_g2_i1:1926-4577(-)
MVCYLSLEYLVGRSLQNAVTNLKLKGKYKKALQSLGINMEALYEKEMDAGLGNGGLGRLAACFLDSMATMNYPATGYGLRYTYGMFAQQFDAEGDQVELPDYWLNFGNPWEIQRLDKTYNVRFGGSVREIEPTGDGKVYKRCEWEGGDVGVAVAYDVPVPGYDTHNTINLRLWSSKPSSEFDLQSFNRGDYYKAIESKQVFENITNVLYPNDNTSVGKVLRLKQQYFFVAATLADIMARFRLTHRPLTEFPDFVAIQLNDTHPAIGIAELMRVLIDVEHVTWKTAWHITTHTFNYTNHTVLPEALERWHVDMMNAVLPRHMKMIFDINHFFLDYVGKTYPGDVEKLRKLSIIEEGNERRARMAHLAIIGSGFVNGVAEIHSELLKTHVFPDFCKLWPHKFQNITNGVTPRRWLHQANPDISSLIAEYMPGEKYGWVTNLEQLRWLLDFAEDPEFQRKWLEAKRHCKERLATYIHEKTGVTISPDALFDVHVKRFHEYKRQLLNAFGMIYRWHCIKQMTPEQRRQCVPRVIIIGGKAAPGYYTAKLIIRLINRVSQIINNDPEVGDLLKIFFLPNYCVSLAEIIIPASDLSQHISTAGMEASGTSNMKFAMNGGLILGTMDGANIEICHEIGEENIFIFGALAHEVDLIRANPPPIDPRMQLVLDYISHGVFGDPIKYEPLVKSMQGTNDYYILGYDFPLFLTAQEEVDRAYVDKKRWARMSIKSTLCMGKFSSDRSIKEYADKIWGIQQFKRPGPIPISFERLAAAADMPPVVVGSPTETSSGFSDFGVPPTGHNSGSVPAVSHMEKARPHASGVGMAMAYNMNPVGNPMMGPPPMGNPMMMGPPMGNPMMPMAVPAMQVQKGPTSYSSQSQPQRIGRPGGRM